MLTPEVETEEVLHIKRRRERSTQNIEKKNRKSVCENGTLNKF